MFFTLCDATYRKKGFFLNCLRKRKYRLDVAQCISGNIMTLIHYENMTLIITLKPQSNAENWDNKDMSNPDNFQWDYKWPNISKGTLWLLIFPEVVSSWYTQIHSDTWNYWRFIDLYWSFKSFLWYSQSNTWDGNVLLLRD